MSLNKQAFIYTMIILKTDLDSNNYSRQAQNPPAQSAANTASVQRMAHMLTHIITAVWDPKEDRRALFSSMCSYGVAPSNLLCYLHLVRNYAALLIWSVSRYHTIRAAHLSSQGRQSVSFT